MSHKTLLPANDEVEPIENYASISPVSSKKSSLIDEEDILKLPLVVRESISLTDDPNIPVITFRYFVLTIIFIIPGAILGILNSFRTTSASYSIFFVQLASHWCGKKLAEVVPRNKKVKLLWNPRWEIDLNPGPWTIKETVLVTISAASGATGNMATHGISLAELYFDEKIHFVKALLFMWGIVFTGYSYAAIARNFLIYEPEFVWPQALMQSTLFKTQDESDKEEAGNSAMTVFWYALVGMTIWQFFPEFIFPFTSSLAILCWISPYNETLNFIGSGLGGMGVLNLSLDWSNLTSSMMINPYWVQIIQFVSFVTGMWIMIPLCKWTNIISFKEGLMSNNLLLSNGTKYPVAALITPDLQFNTTAYEEIGPIYIGAQRIWNIFFDYAAYVSGIVWLVLFGKENLLRTFKSLKRQFFGSVIEENAGTRRETIYSDRLNKLQAAYDDVPLTWFLLLFGFSFFSMTGIIVWGNGLFIPVWSYFIALIFGALIIIPMGWLYAVSNFQLPIGTFNELLYGYMVQNLTHKHPVGASIYGAISGNAWYRAQYMLQDQKIGHYMHIPPKAVFFSQIFGELIGIPVNYIALRWVLKSKREYLLGIKKDPLNQFTGQTLQNYLSNSIQYVLLGPSRLFQNYKFLPYGFAVGLIAPFIFYKLHKKYPSSNFNLFNTTIFFSSMSHFHGYVSTGYMSQFIGGTFTMFYIYRYHLKKWTKYNYLLAAAFDTGYNFALLIIFVFVTNNIKMPEWWGNNEQSVERCFALH